MTLRSLIKLVEDVSYIQLITFVDEDGKRIRGASCWEMETDEEFFELVNSWRYRSEADKKEEIAIMFEEFDFFKNNLDGEVVSIDFEEREIRVRAK